MSDLLDFLLSIHGQGNGKYEVSVRSPAADGRVTVQFPDAIADAQQVAATLTSDWRGKTRGEAPAAPGAPEDFEARLKDTGTRLFNAVMSERVGQWYRSNYDRAVERKAGLRVRLGIQAPELAALPWEYLYDAEHEIFVARNSFSSVVRYVEVDHKSDSLRVDLPLTVLGVVAGPSDQVELSKDVERDRMERALAELIKAGSVQLKWTEDGTFSAFGRGLRQHKPHIVHFIGHGAFDEGENAGTILFERDDGTTNAVSADTLGGLLMGHRNVRLMVLNSCEGARGNTTSLFSSSAGSLVRRGIPAVIAMQYPISDNAAVLFSHELYRGLADMEPVDKAVSSARLQMHASEPESPEWGTPVLYLQSDTGVLFEVGGKAVREPVPRAKNLLAGAMKVITLTRVVVVTIALSLVFLVGAYVFARAERSKAVSAMDAMFERIRQDTSASGRTAAFNSILDREFSGNLEPYAIGKLVDLVRAEHPVRAPCTLVDVTPMHSHEFDAWRHLQNVAKVERKFSERAMDAFVGLLAPRQVRPASAIQLDRVDLRRADLRHLQLDSATFRSSCLVGAMFDSSSLNWARFDSASLDSAMFVDVEARGASFHSAFLVESDFSGARLSNADLFGARAHCAIFMGATLDTARFEHADVPWASFEGASLLGVRRWDELDTLSNAMFVNPPRGATDPAVASALGRGAASLEVDRAEWIDGRDRALTKTGVCGRLKPARNGVRK